VRNLQAQRVQPQPGAYNISFPYYSTVIFRALDSVAAPGTYAFAAGEERKAFAYSEGAEWTIAGATTALDGRATFAETNLTKPNETIAGEAVEIQGLAIQVKPAITDGERFHQARLLAQIATNVSVHLSLNGGQNAYKLGTIGQIPGAGGLVGPGNDDLMFKVDAVADPATFQLAQNGWQVRSNYYKLPEGIIWQPAGMTDSMLQVIFRNERAFTLYAGGDPENGPQADIEDFKVHPAKIATVLLVHLVGRTYARRSTVA